MNRCITPIATALVLLLAFAGPARAGVREDAKANDAARVLAEIMRIPETSVPGKMFEQAHAIAVLPDVVKAGLVIGALTRERLPAPFSLDAMLRLFAHVPPERWPALAQKLRFGADARWFPRGETLVEDSANPQLGITVRSAGSSVRLNHPGSISDLVQVRAWLEALVAPKGRGSFVQAT